MNSHREVIDIRDMDQWVKLASRDPEAFEDQRKRAIDAYLDSVPEDQQRRLRGLQWKIDRVRERSGTPLASCIAISNMMWDSVQRFVNLEVECAAHDAGQPPAARPTGKVIKFYRSGK